MKSAIVIPARYGSTRFPGKPLAHIAGKPMLQRVVEVARRVQAQSDDNLDIFVATDDERIADLCYAIGVPSVMTSADCPTGSDRVLEAIETTNKNFGAHYDFVFTIQGDAPFTPAGAIRKMYAAVKANPEIQVITPVVPLRWAELEVLREQKIKTPFTGTTAAIAEDGRAYWFSKNIIPACRNEEKLKEHKIYSPVHQHLGVYGYSLEILKQFVSWPQSPYEVCEGLEQLRFIENGIDIHTVPLKIELGMAQAGIDSPEDVERAERIIAENPEVYADDDFLAEMQEKELRAEEQ